METAQELFAEVASHDHLSFGFAGKTYASQLQQAVQKTGQFCAVSVHVLSLMPPSSPGQRQANARPLQVVWVSHNFAFLGGSLGCAEGEKVTRAFEYALEQGLPIVVECKTGGARMQEGTSSLMQMAKVSVAVDALRRAGLPFVSVLMDPTYGGVSASYAMQADVRIAAKDARIGFAGPAVILNTMFEMDQSKFDEACPDDFQSARYVQDHGQLDVVIDLAEIDEQRRQQAASTATASSAADDEEEEDLSDEERLAAAIKDTVYKVCCLLSGRSVENDAADESIPVTDAEREAKVDYTKSRAMTRPQAQDIIAELFTDYVELTGDGCVGTDRCIRGGLASFLGQPCVVIGTYKGHTPGDMQKANYGMASPHGYRTALRLMKIAERFQLPVITLVDTCGAWPSFEAERDGQSEAIATNLTGMAGLRVPIVTVVIGEGGSGGALGIGMGNKIGMLSNAYFGVISPEGAASILGRYKDDAHKAAQFPVDCQELATAQQIYAHQLHTLGVIDEIVWENAQWEETNTNFPVLRRRLTAFIDQSLGELRELSPDQLVAQRFDKFRAMGSFSNLTDEDRERILEEAKTGAGGAARPRRERADTTPSKLVRHLAEEVLLGERSRHAGKAPADMVLDPPTLPALPASPSPTSSGNKTAKAVLDRDGPEALARWVREQRRVLVTDTTMRDAHQSLLATRVRTQDLVKGATLASELLGDAFSFECWGGATFDVCYRFLHEDPWERLRKIRAAAPNVCLQMLIRGSNAVGYTSYPDNVVEEFVRLAALNGIDVFRIFDCFNDVEQMRVSIDAVRKAGKFAEVCVCYTSDVYESDIYTLEYYKDVARKAVEAGAHMIGIKDMAGLCRPRAAEPLMRALREVTDLPIHFHTHATSSASLATALEMSRAGCDIIDFATASMADCTSQPSLSAFLASTSGSDRDPQINWLSLEPYDMYWARVRAMYQPFENGMTSGTARVYDHQIPGGQYSNLMVQCKAMGLWDRWEEVLDMYRDVNALFGDIVKVTPSSKCVGDMALYLVTRSLAASDVADAARAAQIDFPASVVELMEGRLGFPHRGFPENVQRIILKEKQPLTVRPSAALPPANFEHVRETISQKFTAGERTMTEEETISYLLYPKVFSDYQAYIQEHSPVLTQLPTPTFFYGMANGQTIHISVPSNHAGTVLGAAAAERQQDGTESKSAAGEASASAVEDVVDVTVSLKRVGPVKEGRRTLVFVVNGNEQHAVVRDASVGAEFAGPMADTSDPTQVASPMPGSVEKLHIAEGDRVSAGQVLATIGAMKMEVDVKSPADGVIKKLHVAEAGAVVEGALVVVLQMDSPTA